jgi:hypothetical protein
VNDEYTNQQVSGKRLDEATTSYAFCTWSVWVSNVERQRRLPMFPDLHATVGTTVDINYSLAFESFSGGHYESYIPSSKVASVRRARNAEDPRDVTRQRGDGILLGAAKTSPLHSASVLDRRIICVIIDRHSLATYTS